jgi:hypothetical protein
VPFLYALLECPRRGCDAQYEGWGTPDELRGVPCQVCESPLEPVAWAEADPVHFDPDAPQLQQRRAA